MSRPLPRIALTPGEPAGIGPDIALMLAQQPLDCELIVIADPELLAHRAEILGLSINLVTAGLDRPAQPHAPGTLHYHPVRLAETVRCGQLDSRNAGYVLETLDCAARFCTQGLCQAVVTGPVQKSILNDAGIPFSGHTEFFAERCGGYPVMMLVADQLRVALATTHLPLNQVSRTITKELLIKVLRILDQDLRTRFGLDRPRIAVCGLNPHAGEGGHLGREEIEVMQPVLESLRAEGLYLTGPIPADTAFNPPVLATHDVILAMYHDQGLPVLKHVGFGEAVNVTLGLPIIRTSVDHGTALDLAGSGRADPGSLRAALDAALNMAQARGPAPTPTRQDAALP